MSDISCTTLSRKDLMKKIRELEFVTLDLNLYLDNHPTDAKAVKQFNDASKETQKIKKVYEAKFGPLTNFGYCQSNCPFEWVDEPWPWEISE